MFSHLDSGCERDAQGNSEIAYCSTISFILLHVAFLLFCRLLLATDLKRNCNTAALPRSSTLHIVNANCSVIRWLAAFGVDRPL